GSLVKTTRFQKPNYLGDPINAVKIFSEKCVDELCIQDIEASKKNRGPDFDLLSDIASEAFMPLSYGGGVTTLDQAARLFHIGFEKVIFNTALIDHPELLS
ncbi:MAG: HisA/HisF-related TIM barrel protein, partial [Clostridia bacterium]